MLISRKGHEFTQRRAVGTMLDETIFHHQNGHGNSKKNKTNEKTRLDAKEKQIMFSYTDMSQNMALT